MCGKDDPKEVVDVAIDSISPHRPVLSRWPSMAVWGSARKEGTRRLGGKFWHAVPHKKDVPVNDLHALHWHTIYLVL